MGLTATPDPIVLDVGLAARSCHKNVLIKKKKINEEKEKKSELTGLTLQTRLIRQTLDSCRESLTTK